LENRPYGSLSPLLGISAHFGKPPAAGLGALDVAKTRLAQHPLEFLVGPPADVVPAMILLSARDTRPEQCSAKASFAIERIQSRTSWQETFPTSPVASIWISASSA